MALWIAAVLSTHRTEKQFYNQQLEKWILPGMIPWIFVDFAPEYLADLLGDFFKHLE